MKTPDEARSGFGRHIRFVDNYDPSLPSVRGYFDQVAQILLNLVKNAAGAVPFTNGEITLSIVFRHGLCLTSLGGQSKVNLPIEISIQGYGSGVAEDIKPYLFDASATNKA